MGVGIAYVFAATGCPTTVVEPDPNRAIALHQVIREQSQQGLTRGKLTAEQAAATLEGVTVVSSVEHLAQGLDLIVESVPERLVLKREVLAALAKRRPKVLATGTSALSIDTLAADLPEPTAFLGMHFFNPVWSLGLVELVRGARTSPATLERALGLVALLAKSPSWSAMCRASPRADST